MTDETRTAIARAALLMAHFLHDGAFAGIVVSGASHELSQSLLKLGWRVQYPDEPLPSVTVLPDAANRMLYKQAEHPGTDGPDRESFAWWLHANLPELEADKGESLCVLDDFALTGHKTHELPRALELQGFTHLTLAVFAAPIAAELDPGIFVAVRDNEAVYELRRLAEHIKGEPDASEMLSGVRPEAERLHAEALAELDDIGRRMQR